jgi:subtilase family serine protease
MRLQPGLVSKLFAASILLSIFAVRASAQVNSAAPRITQPVDDSRLTMLPGNTYPLARPEFDRGAAPSNLAMDRMLLVLKRSPQQEAALEKLMAEQQDKSSPYFHKWLTPAQFGAQFGSVDQDVRTISSWLQSHGFQIGNVSNGRTVIEFSGNAGQVQQAFHTAIHKFVVNGEEHWANVNDPSIPTALTPVVAGVDTLHNFHPKPMNRVATALSRSKAGRVKPQFTFFDNQGDEDFAIGPADFATIYNVQQVWTTGNTGQNQTIAIIDDSNINPQDDADFRSIFGLPANVPVVTVNGANPGLTDDEVEAILDVEWTGAVATNATRNLVVSASTNTTFGGDLSATFIVNEAIPPQVMSESYGLCELGIGSVGNAFYNSTWQQAASEGITAIVSSGDNGAAACDVPQPASPANCGFSSNAIVQLAQCGLAVNGIASTPFNVSVGGTDFNDPNPLLYFSATNTPLTQGSALSYVPEMTYNDSCTNAVVYTFFGFSGANAAVDACNNATVEDDDLDTIAGGGGGFSNCTTFDGTNPASCTGGYAKPSYQMALTPSDGKRDMPDISMFAGDGTISGSFYIVCERDFSGINGAACNLNTGVFLSAGGTSISAQVFAGIMALVDQQQGSSQGNPNTELYTLAGQQSAASCNSSAPPASNCVFNDVTVGTISMPCSIGTLDCSATSGMIAPMERRIQNKLHNAGGWTTVSLATLCCLFSVGMLLLCLPGRHRRWSAALAIVALSCMVGVFGCGGSGSGGGGGGGGGAPNTIGVLTGYNAGTGYDQATGLGTVNAFNLVNASGWKQ